MHQYEIEELAENAYRTAGFDPADAASPFALSYTPSIWQAVVDAPLRPDR